VVTIRAVCASCFLATTWSERTTTLYGNDSEVVSEVSIGNEYAGANDAERGDDNSGVSEKSGGNEIGCASDW